MNKEKVKAGAEIGVEKIIIKGKTYDEIVALAMANNKARQEEKKEK